MKTLYSAATAKSVDMLMSGYQVCIGDTITDYIFYEPLYSTSSILEAKHPALWCYLFQRSIIENNKIRFYPHLAHSEDRLFIFLYASQSKSIQVIKDMTYVYRVVPNSVTHCPYTIKSAEDHFIAASEIINLVLPKCKNRQEKRFVKRSIKSLKSMSYRGYVNHYLSIKTLPSFDSLYLKYFHNRIDLYFGLIKEVIISYCKKLLNKFTKCI